jgi:glycosyltransferase involved in cell wall biosynthesis
LWKQKNHAFLLDIFFELYKTEKDAVLLLAGSGELEREIRDKAHRQGINKSVIFLGNRSDVRDLLQAMDVFVLPSFFEGLPLTLVEAQASGLRCFTSTNVTEEAKVTDLVRYISLSKSAAFWADTISACRGYERQDAAILVKNNGYDIKDVAGKLTQYYSKLAGRA